jgi:ATP-dependent DNA ligase
MRDGLAAVDRVQLHINNGKKKAYIRNGLDWIKRFPVGRSTAFCQSRVKSASVMGLKFSEPQARRLKNDVGDHASMRQTHRRFR